MKSTVAAAMVLVLSAGISFAQDAPPKPAPGSGAVHTITLPDIPIELKEGDGRILAESHCNICHSLDYIVMQPKFPKTQWTTTVNKMIKTYGAPLSPEDAEKIIQYISKQYGSGM
jgi:mono/diheme cytochrome c family protein